MDIQFKSYNAKVTAVGHSLYILIPKSEVKKLDKDRIYNIQVCMQVVC